MDEIVDEVIDIIKRHGIKDYLLDWKPASKPRVIKTKKQLLTYLRRILDQYHPHSMLLSTIDSSGNVDDNEDQKMPEMYAYRGILVIKFFHFFGSRNDSKRMVKSVNERIKKWINSGGKGLIIDLREHYGGSVEPAINSLGYEVLGNTTLFAIGNKRATLNSNTWSNYVDGIEIEMGNFKTAELKYKDKIAVLVSDETESSGEICACIFEGRVNAKIFGDGTDKTAGSLSINTAFNINEEITVYITTNLITTIDGVFHRDQVLHVIKSDDVMNDAVKWIKK